MTETSPVGGHLQCNLCSSSQLSEVASVGDWTVHVCGSCGFKFATPSEGKTLDLAGHYDETYFVPLQQRDALQRWTKTYEKRLEFARQFAPGNRVLDAGCGASAFPIIAAQKGFNSHVLDGSPWAVSFLQDNYDVTGNTCDLNDFKIERGSYDFIHSSHVIEHLHTPRQFLEQLYNGLEDGGVLFLTFPLYGNVLTTIRGLLWKYKLANHPYMYDAPDHVSYFTKKTILLMMEVVGFEIVSVGRYKYISLLDLVNRTDGASRLRTLVKLACQTTWPLTKNIGYYRDIEIYARKPVTEQTAPQGQTSSQSRAVA